MKKRTRSTRHSKITGDFAEGFFLYWLSKYGYECARIDHTGIDLIARDPNSSLLMGISVKSRSRNAVNEFESINVPADGVEKARAACKTFNCVPYYAFLVDSPGFLRGYLLSLDHLLGLVGDASKIRYWPMSPDKLAAHGCDTSIKSFELRTIACSWRDGTATIPATP